jgi:hypothetical protein
MASIKRFRVSFNGGLPDMIAFGITRSSVARKAKALYGPAVIAGVTSISARGAEGMAFMPLPWNSISEAGYMDPPKTKEEVKKRYSDIETDVKNKKSKDLQAVTVKEELQVKKVKITADSPDANKDGKVDEKDDLNGDGVVDAKDVKIAELEKDLHIKQLEAELDDLDDPVPEDEEAPQVPMPERPRIKDRGDHFEVIDHTGKTLKNFKYDSSAEGTSSRDARHQARIFVSQWYHEQLTKAVDAGKTVPMPQEYDSAAAGKKEPPKEKKKFTEALTLLQKKKQMDDTIGEEVEEEEVSDCEMEEALNEAKYKRVQVTVTDPDHPAVSMRGEKVQKFVKVGAEYNDKEAIDLAKKYYKKKGYRVISAEMAGMSESLKPGWMLKADPELAKKVKAKQDLHKKRVASYGNKSAGKSVKEEDYTMEEGVDPSHQKVLDKAKHATPRKPNTEYDRKVTHYLKKKYTKEEDETMEEGNAFIYAAAKAKQAGKKTFEFNGKTYKVRLKSHAISEDFDDEEAAFMAEAFDAEKLTMLAKAGMVSREQLATLKTAMKAMEEDKPLRPQQREVIVQLFGKLADLATNDQTVFQKAKKFAKEEVELDEEQLDELSTSTLRSYRDQTKEKRKAYNDAIRSVGMSGKEDPRTASWAKEYDRLGGKMKIAARKIKQNEEVEIQEANDDLAALRAKAQEISNRIDKIVKSGGRVGLNDPLSRQHKEIQMKIQKAKKSVKEEVVAEETQEYTSANFYADYIKSTKR